MKPMSKFLFLCLFQSILLVPSLYASLHLGSIQGKVIDTEGGTPLGGARVVIQGSEKGQISDAFGGFSFEGLAEGAYQVEVSYLGYETQVKEIRVFAGQSSDAVFKLSGKALEMSEVNIEGAQREGLATLSRIDLGMRPVQSSQELLRSVPGLLIAQHAGGGKAEQIFLRGFDIDHGTDIAINVDGMPVNMVSHAHGQGYADLHFVIPETVERIDLRKGPYAVSDGNFATAGAVDFRTKDQLYQSLVKLEGSSYNSFRGLALLDLSSRENSNQSAYIGSEFLYSDGYFDSPQSLQRLNVFGKYRRFLNENKVLRLSASAFSSSWDASGQIPQRAVDQGLIGRFGAIDDTEGGNTSRYNVNLSLDQQLADGSRLEQRLFGTYYDFELYSNFTFFLEDSINGDQIRQKEGRSLLGYTTKWTKESSLAGLPWSSSAGLGFRYDGVKNNELSYTRNRTETMLPVALGNVSEVNTYVYSEQKLSFSDRLSLGLGLRLDRFSFGYEDLLEELYDPQKKTVNLVSPRINLDYQLSDGVGLYVKGGKGFHSNDSRVVLQEQTRDMVPAAWGADVGAFVKPDKRLLLQGAFWFLDLAQEFVYVGDAGIVEASGQSRRWGMDLSARWQPLDWLFVDADVNLSLPRAVEEEAGQDFIPLAPTRTSAGGVTFKGQSPLSGSVRYRYLGARPANEDWSLTAEGYFLLDAHLNLDLKNVSFNLSFLNMLNQEWNEAQFETESKLQGETESVSEIHFTPGAPRGMSLGFSWRW